MVIAVVTLTSIVITIATNLLPCLSACPIQCQCKWTNQTIPGNHVTCVNQSLAKVPENIPTTVTHLDLHGNNLSSVTNVFQHFTQLQNVNLSFNNLTELHPEVFVNNSNLKYLSLCNNHITDLEDKIFSGLNQLEVLDIADNSITSLQGEILDSLFMLEKLQLQGNEISNLSYNAFFNLVSLTKIDISSNHISQLPPKLFANLSSLSEINLQNNLLTYIDGNIFENTDNVKILDLSNNSIAKLSELNLPNLKFMDLSWNNLTNLTTEYFQHVVNLTTLILDGNQISFIQSPVFIALENLEILSMSQMSQLSYLSKETFLGLDHLKVLNLHNNPKLSFIHKELFFPVKSVQYLNLSYNAIHSLYNESIFELSELVQMDLSGNNFTCDCVIQWLIERVQSNDSIIGSSDSLECSQVGSYALTALLDINIEQIHCSEVRIFNYSTDSAFKIGNPAILRCHAESFPSPQITWITPRKRVLKYHNFHELAKMDYLPSHNQDLIMASSHEDKSYYSESDTREDRIRILDDGSLYIEYVMRSDGGKYKCKAENPRNSTEITILVTLNYSVMNEVKIWSFVVGLSCAGGFFLLNLTYSLTLAAVRRCVSQRRRQQIRELIESMEQYKTTHLTKIKDNYSHQVGRIRDQYHYQLGRLREHHQTQMSRMGRMKEGASQRVEKIRDNYNNQLGRLKGYSSSQLLQLREKYNSQIDKMKDYGNDKLVRLHEKYRLKQQHVLKLLEMMNLDTCRTAFEGECVKAESMILHSEVFTTDANLHSPIDSVSPSDSEYVTAVNSKVTSKQTSREDLNREFTDCDNGDTPSEYSGPINPYLPNDFNDDGTSMFDLTSPYYHYEDDTEYTSETSTSQNYKTKHRKGKQKNENSDKGRGGDGRESFLSTDCDTESTNYKSKQGEIIQSEDHITTNDHKNGGKSKHESFPSDKHSKKSKKKLTDPVKNIGDKKESGTKNKAKSAESTPKASGSSDTSESYSSEKASGSKIKSTKKLDRKTKAVKKAEKVPETKSEKSSEKEHTKNDDTKIEIPSEWLEWTVKESVV